jgi:hypothetical protein
MTNMTNRIPKLAAAAATAVMLTMSAATPSLAFNSNDGGPFIYGSGSNGSARSSDRANAARAYGSAAYQAPVPAEAGNTSN